MYIFRCDFIPTLLRELLLSILLYWASAEWSLFLIYGLIESAVYLVRQYSNKTGVVGWFIRIIKFIVIALLPISVLLIVITMIFVLAAANR